MIKNATELTRPAYLLNVPFGYTALEPNNVWMEALSPEERQVDHRRAMAQWLDLYGFLAAEGLVYLLPTPPSKPMQDLVFTANLGVVLEHMESKDIVMMANFPAGPRAAEPAHAYTFLSQMGYMMTAPPYQFEGEAELKLLHDNVYIGGYGQRTDPRAYDWMMSGYDMRIIKVCETDPRLYHLDCSIFPITRSHTLVCDKLFTKPELDAIAEHTEIIPVSYDDALAGICNSVRVGSSVINGSDINDISTRDKEYKIERHKNRELEDIVEDLGMEVAYINVSEYTKAGALLSCMVMHMNHASYDIDLI